MFTDGQKSRLLAECWCMGLSLQAQPPAKLESAMRAGSYFAKCVRVSAIQRPKTYVNNDKTRRVTEADIECETHEQIQVVLSKWKRPNCMAAYFRWTKRAWSGANMTSARAHVWAFEPFFRGQTTNYTTILVYIRKVYSTLSLSLSVNAVAESAVRFSLATVKLPWQ